jgi:hypothetical protein
MGDPFFGENYASYPLDIKNFYKIIPLKSDKKISCIDGGNLELLPTPAYSVQLNRVYFNIFKNKKLLRIKSDTSNRIEFLSYTSSNFDGKNVYFETKLSLEKEHFKKFLPSEIDLRIKAFETDYNYGNQIVMERMASMARRFSEWTIAEQIIDSELDDGDIIIKDGSLQTAHVNENKYVDRVFEKAKKKGVIFTGLSKTSRSATHTQLSLISSIQQLAEENNISFKEWCYFPIAEGRNTKLEHKVLIMVVKLNRNADTPYRFEMLKEQIDNMSKKEILDVVSYIADYSRDMSLPGYPYGLIDAHLWARVKKEEIKSYQTVLYSEISRLNLWKRVNSHINAINTHDKLDLL